MKKFVKESLNEGLFGDSEKEELLQKIQSICDEESKWAEKVIDLWERGYAKGDKDNEIAYHKADGTLSLATKILDLLQ